MKRRLRTQMITDIHKVFEESKQEKRDRAPRNSSNFVGMFPKLFLETIELL